MNIKSKIALLIAATTACASANTRTITFDTQDYASLGVYDTWEQSPFRTGALQGNVKVLNNHLADESNSSSNILGVQRSIHGSNTFGALIELTEPWETNPTTQYVHVMINKPIEGRVMLIGLGRRTDRPEQSNNVEQFWVYPLYAVASGTWVDAVFPVKTNGGVEIHSLVIVPHCEAPHTLQEDFAAYIDEIEINDNIRPRIGAENYPINFDRTSDRPRTDRSVNKLTFTTSTDGAHAINVSNSNKLYKEAFDTPVRVKPGGTVTTAVEYNGFWMHSYLYLDKGNDGEFSYGVTDNIELDGTTDLVSFSLYTNGSSSTGKNSAGNTISSSNNGFNDRWTPPTFTVPSDLKYGIYRMRYKLDWNNIDAGGASSMASDGGVFIDFLLNVHPDNVTVRQDNRNGEITLEDGTAINALKVPFGQELKIKMNPSNGFTYSGIRVRHGYNLTGDSLVKSNPQYRDVLIPFDKFDSEDSYTLPAELIDGDVLIEGLFIENGTRPNRVSITYRIENNGTIIDSQEFSVMEGDPYPEPNAIETEVSPEYYNLTGVPEGSVGNEDETIVLTIENNLPFIVSTDFSNISWYNLTLTNTRNYLIHNPSLSYISIGTSTTAIPDESNYNAQWAFMGNIFEGFKIVNRATGDGYILSSSTNTSANTGGNTYPTMMPEPVSESNNTYWIPTKSESLTEHNGFYLHQLGFAKNRMNSRDSKVAFWTGGADAGSTFVATHVTTLSGIDTVNTETTVTGEKEYYTLQGVRVSSTNLLPGLYIVRQGTKVSKVLVK